MLYVNSVSSHFGLCPFRSMPISVPILGPLATSLLHVPKCARTEVTELVKAQVDTTLVSTLAVLPRARARNGSFRCRPRFINETTTDIAGRRPTRQITRPRPSAGCYAMYCNYLSHQQHYICPAVSLPGAEITKMMILTPVSIIHTMLVLLAAFCKACKQ